MTTLNRLRRIAHCLLPLLGMAALLSAGHAIAKPLMQDRSHSIQASVSCHDAAVNHEAGANHDKGQPRSLPECCQQDCQCPLASGLLVTPFQTVDTVVVLIAAEFPSVRQLATQWRQDLQRPPI